MVWYICFVLSLFLMIFSVMYAVILARKHQNNRLLSPLNCLLAGSFLAIMTIIFPVFFNLIEQDKGFGLKLILMSIVQTFQVFTIDAGVDMIVEHINSEASPISGIYSTYMSILFLLAPILTVSFVVSLFKNAISTLRYVFHYKDEIDVFSNLNEKTMALARNIKKKRPHSVLIFCDVDREEEEGSPTEEMESAKDLGAILFSQDILSLKLDVHSPKAPIRLFCMSEEESTNVVQALSLVRKYKERKNTDLYVLSSKPEGELLLSDSLQGEIKVRRINPIRSLVNHYLFEQGEEIFSDKLPQKDGIRQIHAVILGLGHYGTEILKALSWYTQMNGFAVEIDAYDQDPLAEDKFSALCPDLLSPKYNGIHIPGESDYTIRIHSGVDIHTKSFADSYASLNEPTIVYVCVGDDSENISHSAYLRMLSARSGCNPIIRTIIYNSEEKEMLTQIKNHRGQEYNIKPFGDLDSMYSEKILLGSEDQENGLENLALKRHMKYDNNEKNFWMVEYNYRSSMASAIHGSARIKMHIPGAEKPEEEWTEEERRINEELEHKRWNAYLRSEGYVYSGSKDPASRNEMAKMHHLLYDYDSLPEEEKRKDGRVGSI